MKPIKPNQTTKLTKKSSNKKVFFYLFTFLFVAGVVGAFLLYNSYYGYKENLDIPNSSDSTKVAFNIPSGTSSDKIAADLVQVNLLKAEFEDDFVTYLKRSGLGAEIQAGGFNIPKDLTMKELAITLQSANANQVWITIPEGLRKDEIAEIVANEFNGFDATEVSQEDFLNLTVDQNFIDSLNLSFETDDLEGFLYPNKYLFEIDTTTEDVVRRLVEQFKTTTSDLDLTYEDVILASMLEREGNNSDEYRMISDIIQRRAEEGWLLQIDATILYYKKDWKRVILQSDLDENQPYNTYVVQGYPPTPISNPGIATLEASVNPEPNSYYFYLHDNEGNIHYSETNQEHESKVQQYLR